MFYLPVANSFSLSMIPRYVVGDLDVREIDLVDFVNTTQIYELISYLGHQNSVDFINSELGLNLEVNRENFEFDIKNNSILILQYSGKRLREGAVELPIEYQYRYFRITFKFKTIPIHNVSVDEYVKNLDVYEPHEEKTWHITSTFECPPFKENVYKISYVPLDGITATFIEERSSYEF